MTKVVFVVLVGTAVNAPVVRRVDPCGSHLRYSSLYCAINPVFIKYSETMGGACGKDAGIELTGSSHANLASKNLRSLKSLSGHSELKIVTLYDEPFIPHLLICFRDSNPLQSLEFLPSNVEKLSVRNCRCVYLVHRVRKRLIVGIRLNRLHGAHLCTSLQSLDASDNQISDVNPVAGLPKLVSLNLSGNRIARLAGPPPKSGVARFAFLTELDLSNNAIEQLTALSTCVELRLLNVSANKLRGALAMPLLPRLTALDAGGNHIESIVRIQRPKSLAVLIVVLIVVWFGAVVRFARLASQSQRIRGSELAGGCSCCYSAS